MTDQGQEGVAAEPPRTLTPLYRTLGRLMARVEVWSRRRGTSARVGVVFVSFLVSLVGVVLLIGPVIGAGLTFDDVIESADTATTDNWIAKQFDAEYILERSESGELSATVTETILVFMPDEMDTDRIERVIPAQMEQYDLNPTLISTQIDGQPVTGTMRRDGVTSTLTATRGDRLTGEFEVVLKYRIANIAVPHVNPSTGQDELLISWDVFGPDWPQGMTGMSYTVFLPNDIADALTVAPGGGIAWLLASASVVLTEEPAPAGYVSYGITNGQNIPPHASAWFTMRFTEDTFELPPPNALYWVLVLLPIAGVLLLILWVLLTIAARRVPWRDARGRAWIVSQSDPPTGMSLIEAAGVWADTATTGVALALQGEKPAKKRRSKKERDKLTARTLQVEQAAESLRKREGIAYRMALNAQRAPWQRKLGLRYSAAFKAAVDAGLRRVPKGAARDVMLLGSVAFYILQLGLLRQMMARQNFSAQWWPLAVFVISTLLLIAIWWLVLDAKPLTTRGTRRLQYLQGLQLYIDQTQLRERITPDDPLLPYVALLSTPDEAEQAIRSAFPNVQAAPHDPRLLSWGRLLFRTVCVLLVAASIPAAFWGTAPHLRAEDTVLDLDVPGSRGAPVQWFEIEGELIDVAGKPRLEVVENLDVYFNNQHGSVPQIMRMYRDIIDGHDLQLTVISVTINGEETPFTVQRKGDLSMLSTTMLSPYEDGNADVVVRYQYDAPIAEIDVWGAKSEQLRWSALNAGWFNAWGFDLGGDEPLRWQVAEPVRGGVVTLTMPTAYTSALVAESAELATVPHRMPIRLEDTPLNIRTSGERSTITIERLPNEQGYLSGQTDIGVQLRFADGTVPGAADSTDWWKYVATKAALPVVGSVLVVLMLVFSIFGIARRKSPAMQHAGWVRDLARWVPVTTALTAFFLAFWIGRAQDEYGIYPPLVTGLALLALVCCIWVAVATNSRDPEATKSLLAEEF